MKENIQPLNIQPLNFLALIGRSIITATDLQLYSLEAFIFN